MYFRADKDLTFDKIEDAVDIARHAGVRVMAAITEEKRAEGGLFGPTKK
jgi:hypothetical protein